MRAGPTAAAAGFLLAISVTTAASAAAGRCGPVTTLATQPAGAFLENMLVERGGAIVYTSYMDKTLRLAVPGREPRVLATLASHPVSVARRGRDIWVAAQRSSFADGPAFMATNELLRIDEGGRVVQTVAAPEAKFLNGMADLPGGDLLIADSAAGVVWRFAPATGSLTAWLRDPLLAPDPTRPDFLPGANGIELVGDRLLISNTSRGTLLQGRVVDGRPGPLSVLALTGPIDDFYVAPDGSAVAATHVDAVIRVSATGKVSQVLGLGAPGSTAVAPSRGGRSILVLTTGQALGGAAGPARLLEVPLGPDGRSCAR